MNKTVTINISGLIFNIDEMAYGKLKNYLSSIERYFTSSVGGEEIMADIEARIAEMFNERISTRKEVISMTDVDHMISVMGQPEDFVDDETREANEREQASESYEETSSTEEDEAQESYQRGPKRFFRDPDGRIIGGVCSGIGYYFGIDPVIIRLLFVIAVLLGFSGVLVYVIFWVITPKAQTRAEKLQMKGRKVNIDNIRQTVKKEADAVKKNFRNIEGKVDDFTHGDGGQRISNFFQDLGRFLVSTFGNILRIVGKFLGIGLMIFGAFALMGLISSIIGIVVWDGMFVVDGVAYNLSVGEATTMIFASSWVGIVFAIGLGLLIGIPILMLMLLGVKIVFGLKDLNKVVGFSLFLSWVLGILMCIGGTAAALSDFSKEERSYQALTLPPTLADTVAISVNESLLPVETGRTYAGSFFNLVKMDKDDLYMANVKFNVIQSSNDSIKLTITQSSRGGSYKEAKERAQNIEFSYSIEDEEIILDPYYKFPRKDKYRYQELNATLAIPVGKTVFLSGNTSRVIYDIKNVTNTHDRYMNGKYWTMTSEGLACLSCSDEEIHNNRNDDNRELKNMSVRELERKLTVIKREMEMKSYEFEHKAKRLRNDYEKKMTRVEQKLRNSGNELRIKEYELKLEDLKSSMELDLKKLNYKFEDEIRELEDAMEDVEKAINDVQKDLDEVIQEAEKTLNSEIVELDDESSDGTHFHSRLLFPNPFRILI